MSIESEQQVIGSIVLDPNAFHDISRVLVADDFAGPRHRAAYRVICELFEEGVAVDEVAIATRLGGGSATPGSLEYVSTVAEQAVSAADFTGHMHAVAAAAKKRKLVEACAEVIREAKTVSFFSKAEAEMWFAEMSQKLHVSASVEPSNIVTAAQAIGKTMDVLKTRHDTRGELPGMRSGYTSIDEYLLGFQAGHLVILAGKPGAGKTALALNIMTNIAKAGNAAIMCSHEMQVHELMSRILSNDARVPGVVMETGRLEAEHYSKLLPASARIGALPMFFSANPPKTIPALMAEAQNMKRKHNLKLLVVDYLQLMDAAEAKRNREQAVSEVSRGLKRIAMELDVCVLALSQLNRQSDRNSEPQLSELRESGALEQDANSVLMIWAEQDDAPEVCGKVAKNRSGQVGAFRLTFKRVIQRFENPHGI